MSFQLPANKSYVKMPVSAWCYIPTSLPHEQTAKTDMLSVLSIQVVLCKDEEGVTNACISPTMPHQAGEVVHLLDRKEMSYT